MKVTLKKAWYSHRGKLYPSGSVFIKNDIRAAEGLESSWYDFKTPDGTYGFVLIPDSLFKIPTPHELYLKELRQQLYLDHIDATKDPLVNYPKKI